MPKSIAILGGGASGVVAASVLASRGAHVTLFEREEQLGGLHRSVVIGSDAFDIGVFLFKRDHALLLAFPFLAPLFVELRAPRLSLTPRGSFDPYPFSSRAYLRHKGWFRGGIRAASSLLYGRIRDWRRDSVASCVRYQIGGELYRETGLQNYIERLYGLPDSAIGVEFAHQRLGLISNFIRRELASYFSGWPGHRRPDRRPQFLARPAKGFGLVYARIAEALRASGVDLRLGTSVDRIGRNAGRFEISVAGELLHFDEIVSTLPVQASLRAIGERPTTAAGHMGLLSLFYRGKFVPDAAVLCNFSLEGCWKRMCVFSRLYGMSRSEDYLTVEVTGLELGSEQQRRLHEDFLAHAMRHGLFSNQPVLVGSLVTRTAYPIFQPGQSHVIRREIECLSRFGVRSVGRQGTHSYISSHDSAQQAWELASSLPLD